MKDTFKLIKAELQRQEDKYGYTDDYIAETSEDYGNGELAMAAAAYLCSDTWVTKDSGYIPDILFPWDDMYFKPSPDDRIKELVKAAAMIVREINRIKQKA